MTGRVVPEKIPKLGLSCVHSVDPKAFEALAICIIKLQLFDKSLLSATGEGGPYCLFL